MKSLLANNFLLIIFFLTSLVLSGCQTIDSRGQYIDDEAVMQLENKRLNKDEVLDLVGTPTIVPDYTPNTWYYVQRSLARRAWLAPRVIEQRIVKIQFDKNNIIEEVTVLNDSHKEDINIISEHTKTYGTELNGVQKFIKNIGRFNKSSNAKGRRGK